MAEVDRVVTWRVELYRLRRLLRSSEETTILLEEASGKKMVDLVQCLDEPVSPEAEHRLTRLIEGRQAGVPLQHLVGHWPFRRLDLRVDGRALIPRPETEEVVEIAIRELASLRQRGSRTPLSVLELGTGSGAIALSLVDEIDDVEVVALERSKDALSLAHENAERLSDRARARLRFESGDWRTDLERVGTDFDLLVANPPYLSVDEWGSLAREVKLHEPYAALVAGKTGLEDLRRIVGLAPELLRSRGGTAVVEIGWKQRDAVWRFAEQSGARSCDVLPDLAGHDRVLVCRYGEAS